MKTKKVNYLTGDCALYDSLSKILLENEEIPIPTTSYSMDPDLAEKWAQAFCWPEDVAAARALLKATRYIAFDDEKSEGNYPSLMFAFRKMIHNGLIPRVNDRSQLWAPRFAGISDRAQSSDYWLLRLALKEFPDLGDNMCRQWSSPTIGLLHSGVKTFVFFDDAMYSGLQITTGVEELIDEIVNINERRSRKALKPFSVEIIVAVAYTSKRALENFNVLKKNRNDDIRVNLLFGAILPDLTDVLPNEDERKLVISKFENRVPVYFQHKMADLFSTYTGAYEGEVNITEKPEKLLACPARKQMQRLPYIRGCLTEHASGYACPYPPYKDIKRKRVEKKLISPLSDEIMERL